MSATDPAATTPATPATTTAALRAYLARKDATFMTLSQHMGADPTHTTHDLDKLMSAIRDMMDTLASEGAPAEITCAAVLIAAFHALKDTGREPDTGTTLVFALFEVALGRLAGQVRVEDMPPL